MDVNDTLYSQIIRAGYDRCLRCRRPVGYARLQCAHIIGRAAYYTRFMLRPICNAVHLCSTCHDWFDGCKNKKPIFEPEAREHFTKEDNAYTFLVSTDLYDWNNLAQLYAFGQVPYKNYSFTKKAITAELRAELKKLEVK